MSNRPDNIDSRLRQSSLIQLEPPYLPVPSMIINQPKVMKLFDHARMNEILGLLRVGDHTIMDLKEKLDLNPGSVKRYIDQLLHAGLIRPSKVEMNKFHIKLKYYRITALEFEIRWRWPSESS